MTVRQMEDQKAPPVLTIYFSGMKPSKYASLNASKNVNDKHAPKPQVGENAAVVDVRNLAVEDIWKKVRSMTGAQEVEASEADKEEVKKLEAIRAQAEVDRERVGKMRQAKKDQERMLEQARKEVEKLRELS